MNQAALEARKTKAAKAVKPEKIERWYRTQLTSLVRAINRAIARELLPIVQQEKPQYQDSELTTDSWPARITAAMALLNREFLSLSFRDQLQRLAVETVSRTEANSTQQFIESLNRAVGVDVSAMIQQEGLTEYLDAAVAENVNLIVSIPQQYLTQVETIVLNGMRSGLTPTAISKQLQAQAGVTKRRAAFIARDQVAKLNSDIVRRRQQSAGISYYKVITSNDERVSGKPGGLYPNAKISCWAIARKDIGYGPGVYTWKDGAEYAGQKGLHPGKHHPGCRCTASPIFDWQLPKKS